MPVVCLFQQPVHTRNPLLGEPPDRFQVEPTDPSDRRGQLIVLVQPALLFREQGEVPSPTARWFWERERV